METFIKQQTLLLSRAEGSKVFVKAGGFYWFLVKLEQRQERMKALISLHDPKDPFVKELDPGLRKRIKAGWSLLRVPPGFSRFVDELTSALRSGPR